LFVVVEGGEKGVEAWLGEGAGGEEVGCYYYLWKRRDC